MTQRGTYKKIDFRPYSPERWADILKRKEETMRIASPAVEKKHQVVIKRVMPDDREYVEKDGKKVKNENFGGRRYETVETIDVLETTDAELKEAVLRGLMAASKK